MLRLFALWLIFLPLGASLQVANAQVSGEEFQGQEVPFLVSGDDYFLKEGDVIEVTVREDPGLNRRLMIGPDGKVNMALAGVVIAAGNTVEAVQNDIFRRLQSSFVADPTVTVSLVALGAGDASGLLGGDGALDSKTIFVMGRVARPGPYSVDRSIGVLQALSLAGGFDDFAATKRIQVRRTENGQETVHLFNYDDVEDGELAQSNIELLDGDTIVVPKRGLFE